MSTTNQERAMTIALNLKRFREAKKLTQREVWEAAGISKSSYTSYEAGRSDPYRRDHRAPCKSALG
ncbi:helix-turn-helix transcriptional regulator [Pseudomonas aeruginosa]|uniref:helix-turn-helix domain-containing protein n=1 Tax=Pseudomonas aeruginosa TaxID=287 RepID=UPI0034A5412D